METLSQDSRWAEGVHFESLANLAHELRTPVQVLLGYLDILREERPDGGMDRAETFSGRTIIERMNANVHELAQTVDNVLEIALAYAGADSAIEEEIELAEFFAELDEVLQAAKRNSALAVRTDLTNVPRILVTRRRALRSIVLNLGINAIKFTDRGEVAIEVCGGTGQSQNLDIEVRDTGAGISDEQLAAAFEPLVQLSSSSRRIHRGLGLGLALVRHHVDALCGRLLVESIPGRGSCFKVRIPCRQSAPEIRNPGQVHRSATLDAL